jgi:hypothetical protein
MTPNGRRAAMHSAGRPARENCVIAEVSTSGKTTGGWQMLLFLIVFTAMLMAAGAGWHVETKTA